MSIDHGSVGLPTQVEVELEDGDLVVMGGTCQRTHKHAVPPSAKRNGSYLAEYTQFYRWKVDSSNMFFF